MCRFPLLFALLLLVGCPTVEEPALAEIIWDPPLSSDNGGELDFGSVAEGDAAQEFARGTNNTEETITFEIDVILEVGDGWIYTVPPTWDVEPGEDVSFGPRFNPSANTPDESSGTVAFIWDEEIVTYVISAAVDR